MGFQRKKADGYGEPFVRVSGVSTNALPDGTTMFCWKENGKAMNNMKVSTSRRRLTAFWRFKLKGWTGKMFYSLAGRALCGWLACYLPGWAG